MNRKTAKLIRHLAKVSGRSEKSLKKEYYNLGNRERFEMKQEMKIVFDDPRIVDEMLREVDSRE